MFDKYDWMFDLKTICMVNLFAPDDEQISGYVSNILFSEGVWSGFLFFESAFYCRYKIFDQCVWVFAAVEYA